MAARCRLLLPGVGEACVPLPISCQALRTAALQHFGAALPGEDFVITDTLETFESDADMQRIRDGATLVVTSAANRALAAPASERISFQPHPKTLTMAGEFEYFAAQGRHPFVYALAEFVDNSLRATRRTAPHPRSITVSLVVSGNNPATARGLVAIQDNGCGMNKLELTDWAVMNLSMEERGAAPQEPQPAGRGGGGAAGAPGAGRFLTGDLSFFGVGSKNAGFFMGSSIKVATKRADELYVHELRLAAADLEQRYQNREEVYVEEMIHRNPADPSTLSSAEQPFSCARTWVAAEGEDAEAGGTGPSFTRVVISDLKPDVLRQIMADEQGTHICQELAHLYHYYLHGEQGNRSGGSKAMREGRLPNGEPFPEIVLRYQVDSRIVWQQRLAEVEDDLETRLLRAQQAELPFTLQVPDKGTVCGVLYYFPFQNDQETVPVENPLTSSKPATSPFGPGARATQLGPTQLQPRGTQHLPHRATQAPRGTQLVGGAAAAVGGLDEEEDEEAQGGWQSVPIFEAFWQGRLIPGARIDTLPFLEAVRSKRNAQAKDMIPDEAFRRLRGALFFGPAFRVTRNKLLFRDSLPEVLATAVPGERQMEAKLRQWLQRCHSTLDKSVRFETLADSRTQSALRSKLGEETTAFDSITDGAHTISKGDVVRVNAKPQVVGRVLYFTIPQAVREEGAYANGRLHIELIPAEVYGPSCEKQFSLRRLEAVLSEAEQQDHLQKELLRAPTSLRIDPMRFSTGQALEFTVGDTIPETAASVLSGSGQRMSKTAFTSERFLVTQRLWRLPAGAEGLAGGAGDADAAAAAAGEEEEGGRRAAKRQRKGRKGKGRQDENADPVAAAAAAGATECNGMPPGAELMLTVENKTPLKDTFQFARISDGLHRSGSYALEFVATPALPGQQPLRTVVQLAVAPGPPCSFSLSGEGKAVTALKDIALGEALPPIKVMFSDRFGNPVAMQPTQTPPCLSIAALTTGPLGELQQCEELQVVAQQAAAEDGLLITDLQLLGSEVVASGPEAPGLQLLASGDGLSHPTGRQAQVQPSKQSLPAAEVQLSISLQGSAELESVKLPLRLRAGAPQCLRLLPGHPWEAAQQDGGAGVVTLQSGGSLAAFQVVVFDAWGNPTAPSADLGFTVLAECQATGPQAREFTPSGGGITTVEGLVGVSSTGASGPATFKLSLKSYPCNASTEAAVAVADPTTALTFPLAVEPSMMPTSIQVLRDGQPLPTKEVQGDDGPITVALLDDVSAGSSVVGLCFVLLDEGGTPAAQQLTGKVTLSWKSGSKKFTWDGEGFKLPPVKVPESVANESNQWMRFTSIDPAVMLEMPLEIRGVPAEPASWTISMVDQVTSQNSEVLGVVQCGQPFALEMEAIDAFNNRCGGGSAALPLPGLTLESEGPLQYNEQEWEQGWVSQGGEQVYAVRMIVSGHPGRVKITVRDTGGEGSNSLLGEDSLFVELRAGPPAQLAVEGPATLECGTKMAIPQLRVRVCDSAGNPTTGENFEVSLCSSALATDGTGRAASVSVSGGNKIKLKQGVAVFKDVRVVADEAGSYALRVQGASRKVAVQDAVLHLIMQQLNAVTNLRVLLSEVLESSSCQAGTCSELHVAVMTENGLSLPPEVAVASLALKVSPPGGGKNDVVSYMLPAPEQPDQPVELQTEDGHYVFQLPELTAAGTYTAVAEYAEARPDLAAGLSNKDAKLRSASVRFEVHPCQPVTMRLEAASLPEKVAVTNGSSGKQRLILRNAAVQLQDVYGNAAGACGVQVRCRLRLPTGAAADSSSHLPELQSGHDLAPQETDERGRAFLGDLSIAEGSGHAASGALQCELVCEALGLYPSSAHELETDGDGWAVCWSCPVLFSDDAARFAHIERLNQQRGELAQRREELNLRISGAQQALAEAQERQHQAQQAMASKEEGLPAPAPNTLNAAKKQLAAARRQAEAAAVEEPEDVVEARYGNPKSTLTASIDRILQSGDPGLVGVVAQLATVDDKALSAVLVAACRSQLATVVVQDIPARQRVAAMLVKMDYPVPDMLPATMMLGSNAKNGDTPGFASAGQRARALHAAACRGADPPLAIPLPHTAAISKLRDTAEGVGMSATDWPRGCLGYAVNLVRPTHKGHRANVLFSQLSNMLVFETLQDAEEYKEFLSQKLRIGTGMFLSLDGRRIMANGVVSGASFQVPALEKADMRFGSSGALGENPAAAQAAEQVALLEEWVELLRARRAADAAQEQAEQVEAECRSELESVEVQIAELDAQLALGDIAAGGGAAAGGQTGRKKRGRRQQQQEEEEVVVVEESDEQHNHAGQPIKRRRRTAA